jgi:hydrogenase maturation protease
VTGGPRGYWEELERPAPDAVTVAGREVRRRSRVVLRPRPGGDVFDVALAGRTAVVEELVQGVDGGVQLAVTIEGDPGQDLGEERQIGHRFFFRPEEVEPLGGEATAHEESAPRILVAGIGNVFLGDDGFGVEVAGRLLRGELRDGVHVEDFGIRGMDLAYALSDYDVAVLVDATPRGRLPGTLYLIEPELENDEMVGPDAHGMDPVKVLSLARALGGPLPRVLIVGCEPATRMTGEEGDVVAELSEPVRAAIAGAVRMVESLIDDLVEPGEGKEKG